MLVIYTFAVPASWFQSAELTGTISAPPPHTWIVDDDGPAHFRKIQDAINVATSGDTILVRAGTYYENVVVNKSLLLIGENKDATVIDGGGTGNVLNITASHVVVENFTIMNSGGWPSSGVHLMRISNSTIKNSNIKNNYYGIVLEESSSNTISENIITNNDYYGISIGSSSNSNKVFRNRLEDNIGDGIYIGYSSKNTVSANNMTRNGSTGIFLYFASNNTIFKNNIKENKDGIVLLDSSNNNTISENNVVANTHIGIFIGELIISGSSNNTIYGNTLTANSYYGIIFENSSDNKIFHNNFNNTNQVLSVDSMNVWDDGYPSGGNYWSDYTGVDVYSGPNQDKPGDDGIGDTPYVIDENNQDNYPFMGPWTPQDMIQPATFDDYDGLWHTSEFTITLTAYDVWSGIKETYYRINEGSVQNISAHGHPLIITESANNTLEYWSVDKAGIEEIPHNFLTGIKLDKTAPTGSIIINEDDEYTTSVSVTLTLTADDATSGVYQVRFSNDGIWDVEPWEDFTTTKIWTLTPQDGTKTVYYQIRDVAGLLSSTYSDTITLDTTAPTGSITINKDATYTNSTSVTLTLTATDETSSVAQMRFSNDNISWSDWESFTPTKSWTLSAGDGTKTVYVQFMDNAGLISQSYLHTILLDTTPPIANAGPDQTVNVGETVSFDAGASTDNIGIASFTWDFGDGTTGTGETTTHTYTKPGSYTVTLTVTDLAGNTAQDTITINVLAPPFPIWTIAAATIIIALGIAITAAVLWKRRK
jgi:parallel beta-helix repeat protein